MKKKRRGIYLISTLLLLTFLVMVGGAVMVSFQQGMASSGSYNNRQMALQAAMSGLQYVEARLETNALNYSPTDVAAIRTTQTLDGALQIAERGYANGSTVKGWNICGFMTNSNVASPTEGHIYTLFRASFNTDYSTFYAQPTDWTLATFAGTTYNLPAIPYVSMNMLARPSNATGKSYSYDGTVLQTIPGGTADIVVEGLAVSPTGTILARRTVESIVSLKSAGTLGTASSAAGDLGLNVLKSGGTVTVSAADPSASWAHTSGLSALNNIDMYGVDAAGANAPPGYTSGALANLGGGSKTFTYTQGQNPSQNYTANVAQTRVVQPPAIRQDQLPGQNSPATVNAGTYVVWNGGLYYYGTDYDSSKALTSQPWSQTDPTQPPKYNNVAGTAVNIDSTGKMAFDANTNTLTVQKDVLVQKANGLNNFSLVVAPSQYDGGSLQSTIDSNAVGSAQIQFTPATSTDTPQFRSPGSITVIGNVVGQGSLVATGLDGSNRITGDITVVGKSSIDNRSDSGVALYASGDLNFLQLSQAQAPSAVPAVGSAFGSQGIVPGSGSNGNGNGGNPTPQQIAVYQALANAVSMDGPNYTGQGGISHTGSAANPDYNVFNANVSDLGADLADNARITSMQIDLPGHPGTTVTFDEYRGGATPHQYIWKVMQLAGVTGLPAGGALSNADLGNLLAGVGAYGIPPMNSVGGSSVWVPTGSGASSHFVISSNDVQSFVAYGLPVNMLNPSPTPTPVGSPSPGATTSSGALDQSFSGLVYAGGNIRLANNLGNLSISGALAAYGGDPRSDAPGQGGGGNILLSGNSINIQYNPALLGPYAAFFGGQVSVRRNCLTVY